MKLSTLICALALVAGLTATAATAETLDLEAAHELLQDPAMLTNDELSLDPAVQTQQIEAMIAVAFADKGPEVVANMIKIADCESYGGHRDGMIMHIDPAGYIVENSAPNSSATGALMVLLNMHRPEYSSLDLDPKQVAENIVFGRHLMGQRVEWGHWIYAPWKPCADIVL